uniref:Zinc finger C2H2 LYAR-type domain-containing protein n=1 Tax=Spongospora subterranea TaxID=70186 RepID=A0A0H5R9R5_9EUKA|eukprot:CRZ10828.1 hypothetical protein [Spongospora subterranea]
MVSFCCDGCNETLKKQKVASHYCGSRSVSCIDCSTTFYDDEYASHTSCISEAAKHQKGLYREKKKVQKSVPKVIVTKTIPTFPNDPAKISEDCGTCSNGKTIPAPASNDKVKKKSKSSKPKVKPTLSPSDKTAEKSLMAVKTKSAKKSSRELVDPVPSAKTSRSKHKRSHEDTSKVPKIYKAKKRSVVAV